MSDNDLTEHGERTLDADISAANSRVEKLEGELARAKKYRDNLVNVVKPCQHEFDPNEPNGGPLMVSTCIHCSYSWYD